MHIWRGNINIDAVSIQNPYLRAPNPLLDVQLLLTQAQFVEQSAQAAGGPVPAGVPAMELGRPQDVFSMFNFPMMGMGQQKPVSKWKRRWSWFKKRFWPF